jgi:arabinose-5-phosphate isomerase
MHSSLRLARVTLAHEIAALSAALERLGPELDAAVDLIAAAPGKVIVSGLGKSGAVGRKIAATLASTGTPAMFVHPVEAVHGDFGMVQKGDVALLLSKSGETPEVVDFLRIVRGVGLKAVGLIGRRNSTLARTCDVFVDAGVEREACPLDLVPTSSTTVAMALGDALACCLLERRGFTREDFSKLHPSGSLGKRLLLRVRDVMHKGNEIPLVKPGASLMDVLLTMSAKGMGAVLAATEEQELMGIFTDGDVRRCFARLGGNIMQLTIDEVMVRHPVVIKEDELAVAAVRLMEDRPSQISVLPVVDAGRRLVGIVRIHDLVRAGL